MTQTPDPVHYNLDASFVAHRPLTDLEKQAVEYHVTAAITAIDGVDFLDTIWVGVL